MSDNVVSLGPARIKTDRKARFIEQLAATYDGYVEKAGAEPDALVLVVGGVGAPQSVAWFVGGDSEGMADAVVARALITIQRELLKYE